MTTWCLSLLLSLLFLTDVSAVQPPDVWGNYLIKGIVETPAPTAISWWPTTLGWQLVGFFLLYKVIYTIFKRWRRYVADSYRREALATIEQLPPYIGLQSLDQYRQLPMLLRQVALHAFDREQVVALTSVQWEQWLDRQCSCSKNPQSQFSARCPNVLHQLSFQQQPALDQQQIQMLLEQIILWIKYHRRQDV